jgi:L-2-hydroxycarboxylate dehydrogenase (NAD+)
MPEIRIDQLKQITLDVLQRVGVSLSDAQIVSDTIVFAHQTGKGTHGISRLPIYIKKIKNGSLNPASKITIIKDKPVVKIWDANNGFGQVVAYRAMNAASEMANQFGVGIVGVRNSNNFGTIAYFLDLAARKDMISLIMSNSAPAIAPWGGSKALFGTNPMGFGFPNHPEQAPIIFDMATAFAARGKIRLAAKNGEKIPFGWALDANGNPTDNPEEALKGSLLPIGEHKGAGLAMIVDIFAGLIPGSAFAGNVLNLNTNGEFSRNGHFIMAINPDFFLEKEEYQERIRFLIERMKSENGDRISFPGERAQIKTLENATSVAIGEKPIQEINNLLTSLELPLIY